MGVGRFFCVALPFILSVGSLIFLLIACLGGVSNKDLYMFRVDTRELEISRSELEKIISNGSDFFKDASNRGDMPTMPQLGGRDDSEDANVTAKDLGLDNIYDVALWGYCTTDGDGDRKCTEPEFDWAAENLNTSWIEAVGELSNGEIELPEEVHDALEQFKKVVKWTQVAYIIAFIALALTVVFGIFANCTRIMSCVTFIVAWIAAIAVGAAAGLSTATSVIVVSAVKALSHQYGVDASFNGGFLALVWLSTACALGASFFWLFTICCCAPSKKDRKSRGSTDGEKLLGGGASRSYQPLDSPGHNGFYNANAGGQYGAPRYPQTGRSDMAYEPYSHRV